MTTLFYSVMIVVPAAVLLASVVYTMKKHSEGQSIKKSLRMNAATFAVMVLLVAGCAMGAFATGSEDTTAATSEDLKAFCKALIFVALGESIALYGVVISILILNKV